MSRVDCVVETEVADTFRAQQVAGMFGMEPSAIARQTFSVEVPGEDETWQIGVIVGPSGSGKSTIARMVYGERLIGERPWPDRESVVDGFSADAPIGDVTSMLTAVGFSSPPAWLRPYRVLSNGEKFRCDLARAILESDGLLAFDEFTSVVDRTVAKIGSAAVAKAVRRSGKRFVAVTCHYDVIDWLEPDWVLDMASGQLARGRLWRRPAIKLTLRKARTGVWPLFAKHHYLNHGALGGCRGYVAELDGQAVCFVGVGGSFGHKGLAMIRRVVTLPDFQGIGIGTAATNAVAELTSARQDVTGVRLVTGNPAMIASLQRSPRWRTADFRANGSAANRKREKGRVVKSSQGRPVASFEFRPGALRGADPAGPCEVSAAETIQDSPASSTTGQPPTGRHRSPRRSKAK